jgi:hypothetical protein
VVGESILPKREKDMTPPMRLVRGLQVQHNGHQGPDGMQYGSLSMESDDVVGVESRGKRGLGSE